MDDAPRASANNRSPRRLPLVSRLRLRAREHLADRIALVTAGLTLAFALTIGAVSFAYSVHQARSAAQDRLHEATRDAAVDLARRLDGALNDIRLLSHNPTVVSAVLDVRQQESYLRPVLSSFRPVGREADLLCVADYRGRLLACASDRPRTELDRSLVNAVIDHGRVETQVVSREGESFLRLAAPIVNPESGVEGLALAEIRFARLLDAISEMQHELKHVHLIAAGQQDVFRSGTADEGLSLDEHELDVDPALRPLGLKLHLSVETSAIGDASRRVFGFYLIALLVVLPVVYLTARRTGAALAARAQKLARSTSLLASGDAGDWQVSQFGEDEIGTLAQAFRGVVEELQRSRDSLEAEVKARTLALQQSLDEVRAFKTAVEQSPLAVVITDVSGTIRFVNPDFERITGYSKAEAIGQTPHLLKSGRMLPYEYGALWASISSGKVWRGEFENRRKDGGIFFAQASIAPLRDESGVITGYVAIEEDITHRRRFERELRERESYLRTLVESLPDTLLVLDHEGRIAHLRTPDQPIGRSLQAGGNAVGRHFSEVLPRELAAPLGSLLRELSHHLGARAFEYTLKQGEDKRHFSATVRRIDSDDPERDGYVVLSRDVSEAYSLQSQLIRSEARFRTLLEDIETVAVQGYNRDRQVLFWNKASEQLYGWSRDEAIGQRLEELIIPSAMRAEAVAGIERWYETGEAIANGELTLCDKNGQPVHVFSCHAMQNNVYGEPELFCVDIDLSDRRRAEARMREALVVFNASSQGIMTTDANGVITAINPAFSLITGYRPDEVIGRRSSTFKSGRHDPAFYEAMWDALTASGSWEGEIWNRRKNGEIYPQWLTISAVRDNEGRTNEYVAMFSDISLRKQQEEVIWRQANFDSLTGLANRNLLNDRLERAIAQARRNGRLTGLLYLDLDGFKQVNDEHGHAVGDELLVDVAQRLSSCVREQDTVARMGGDEFTVVVHDVVSREDLITIARKIVVALRAPYLLSAGIAHLSASVGVAVCPQDGEDGAMLLRHADAAMYAAKESGKDQVVGYQALAERSLATDTSADG